MPRRLSAEELEARDVPALAYALSGTNLVPFDTGNPAAALAPIAITLNGAAGIFAGETLVGIDFRPQNGFLYGLGVNATADTATLYAISTQTGVASIVGPAGAVAAAGQIALTQADGTTVVDLPDPATVGYGFDFNPSADRIRVTTTSGLNFRINPNTGRAVDTAAGTTGTQGDPNISGSGQTGADAVAYTNDAPNTTTTAPVTTLYALNSATNQLFIITNPNGGTAGTPLNVTLNGAALDFTAINGFDIPAGVNATANNTAVTAGTGFAVLTVGGTTSLYSIDLTTGAATQVGAAAGATTAVGLAIRSDLGGIPAVGLDATGANLVRILTSDAGGGSAAVAITGVTPGETLVGIDYRPSTGQLYALGVDEAANIATLYLIDPQGAVAPALTATPVGAAGSITLTTAGGTTIDLPAASAGYGFDFNPVNGLIRVTTGTGLNFRVNPDTGAAIDTDAGPIGNQPDPNVTGLPTGSTGVTAAAYTNNFGGATATTLYTLDAASNSLFIQGATNPPGPNGGVQSGQLPVTLNGAALDFTDVNGFDIPAPIGVTTGGTGAVGTGYALLTVGGTTGLYAVDLASGAATLLEAVGTALAGGRGLALGQGVAAVVGGANVVPVSGRADGTATLFTISPTGAATAGATLTPFAGFTGVVRTARGDVNGDLIEDTIFVTGPGTAIKFTVISGVDNTTVLIPSTSPFAGSEDFTGGGFVAAGDFNNDGRDEVVVTPDQGGGPRVTIYSLPTGGGAATVVANFLGIDDVNFRGGARPAVGDVNRDGTDDLIVAAGFLGGPRIAIFNGTTVLATPTRLINDFFAFPGEDAVRLRNGAFVAAGDVNGDGFDDLIFGGGPGGAPRVFLLSGALVSAGSIQAAYDSPIANFFVAGNSTDRGGVRVGTVDADGDARADVLAASGENVQNAVRVYLGKDFATGVTTEPPSQTFNPYGTDVLTNGVFVG